MPQRAKSKRPKASPWQGLSLGGPAYRGRIDNGGQAWLLTFTDLTALLLTFFVLLYSMSTINDDDWQNLVDALSPRLSGLQEVTVAMPSADEDAEEVERIPGTDLNYLFSLLQEQMAEDPILAKATVAHADERITLALPGDLLFASGSTDLGEAASGSIFALGAVLGNLRNVVEIAGYADPLKPRRTYATNWELSLARATVLSAMLGEGGYEGEILVRGYGHAQYRAPADPADSQAAMAAARRVEIVIHAYAAELR
ncbi:flagellar motor protein MotB [Pelagibius sp.]|uniref:OmpA/MotB family protein n=1 Tax=Pelagibius sp. TaxID=1931238 RepID=UPI002601F6A8|nr:flagellar motor protein MotB [Pelagibius sp.]